jgi:AraC-like DNA-binding protein
MGRTPRKQITDAHVALAKSLLVDTDLPMSAVAARSGFTTQQVFSTVFKRTMAITPIAYRKQFRVR